MTERAPAPPAPKLPVSLAANPKLSSWLRFSPEGQVTVSPGKVEIGQGIVTALAQIAADELDVDIGRVRMVARIDGRQPQRRRHLRQPFRAAVGPRDPAGLCRSPADLSCCRVGSAGRRDRRARSSATASSPDPAMSGPAIGNLPTRSRWIATRRRARCPSGRRSARWPEIPSSGSIFPTRFSRIRVSFTTQRCRGCCMAACCGRKCPRAKLVDIEGGWRARRCRPGRHRARRQFRRRRQRNRGWRGGRLRRPAQGRDMVRRRNPSRRKRSGGIG